MLSLAFTHTRTHTHTHSPDVRSSCESQGAWVHADADEDGVSLEFSEAMSLLARTRLWFVRTARDLRSELLRWVNFVRASVLCYTGDVTRMSSKAALEENFSAGAGAFHQIGSDQLSPLP